MSDHAVEDVLETKRGDDQAMMRSDHAAVEDAIEASDCGDHDEYDHGLVAGDHVIRWTHLALYPIQVHGIVLSAGPGLVTLADFGLTSQARETWESGRGGEGGSSEDLGKNEEEAVKEELKRKDSRGTAASRSRRIVVVTLIEEKEIRWWRKVDWGDAEVSSKGLGNKLLSWLPGSKGKKKSDGKGSASGDDAGHEVPLSQSQSTDSGLQNVSAASRTAAAGNDVNSVDNEADDHELSQPLPPSSNNGKTGAAPERLLSELPDDDGPQPRKTFPKSDPAVIVLARVRYLLEHECTDDEDDENDGNKPSSNSVLPPYHVFYANSECIAVWCKTGTFSTLQAAVFLHSTAIGQAKSAATLALFVGGQTATVAVPAGGIMGWFGATTTATVPLLTAQPWLIPALAGYGIAVVGGPYLLLMRARGKWDDATRELGDGFWEWAIDCPDVYVEAIRCWSGIDDI